MARTDVDVMNVICQRRLVAVVRCDSPDELPPIAHALLDGGIEIIEVTMTVPGAIEGLRRLVDQVGDRAIVGAGTVLDSRSCAQAIDSGASFVVSPCLVPGVVKTTIDRQILSIPGCFSPAEVFMALDMGAPMVKLFPASVLGPQFIREIHGPFPGLRTMPTGGIDIDNIGEFLSAGASAIGLGSRLVDKAAISKKDYQRITMNARAFRAAVDK